MTISNETRQKVAEAIRSELRTQAEEYGYCYECGDGSIDYDGNIDVNSLISALLASGEVVHVDTQLNLRKIAFTSEKSGSRYSFDSIDELIMAFLKQEPSNE